jgi:carotenoid cleavage dioxygenase-like enzyme
MTATTTPPYLTGNYAPVTGELTAHDLRVTGTLPPGLIGWYLRNGPNPHDAATDTSDVAALDADNLTGPPVATIHLPRRVPSGFHGNWLPDEITA